MMSDAQQTAAAGDYGIGAAPGEEFLSDLMVSHISALNHIVAQSKAPLEGNLFYKHHTPNIETFDRPDPRRVQKRRNFYRSLAGKVNLFEIGFNGGHSALLALSSSPQLKITCVDIGRNAYVAPCAEYMKEQFGDRFDLIIGDSRDVVPEMAAFSDEIFDIVHVDGGHGVKNCIADIANALALPRGKTSHHLLLDDTNAKQILEIFERFVARGHLIPENLQGGWEGVESSYALICERSDEKAVLTR